MITGSSSLEEFWCRARNNLSHMYSGHHRYFWLYELSVWLHMVANTMLAIYIPILMLQSGFELKDVLLFYVIFHVVNTPTNYLAGLCVSKIGARRTIIIATLFQVAFFVSYALLDSHTLMHLITLGALAAVYDAFYYTASMYVFMQTTIDVENSGKNTGILHAVIRSAGLIGPIIGSTVLVLGGHPNWVIATVVATFIASLVPLFWISLERGYRSRMIAIKEFLRQPHVLGDHLSLGLFKIHEISGKVLWPIFIFLFFESIESVAALAVLIPVVALVMSFASGHISPRWRFQVISISAIFVACIWIGRILVVDPSWYYLSVVLATMLMVFMQVPIDANIFRNGNQTNPLTASVVKNMFSMGTKAILFIILYVITLSFSFKFALAAGALFLLASISIARLYNKQSVAK